MKISLAFLLSIPAFASISNVTIDTTSAQALVSYVTSHPDSRAHFSISQSSGLSPLFSCNDPGIFPGSNSDAQWIQLDSGSTRSIVIGEKANVTGGNLITYPCALQTNTQYFIQITDTFDGSTSSIVSFTTRVALGLSYIDPVQADPAKPGEILNPIINWATRQTYVDAQTGLGVQPLTLPHDITGAGTEFPNFNLTNSFTSKIGTGWIGSNYPYSITNDSVSALVAQSGGLRFWPPYPYDWHASSYGSDVGASFNWMTLVVTAQSSNAGCPGLGSRCIITVCMSEDRVNCDPWSNILLQTLTNTSATYTFGSTNIEVTGTLNGVGCTVSAPCPQGGWIKPGYRMRNGPETVDRNNGTVTCDGTSKVVFPSYEPTNILWSNGTPITINGTQYLISSVANENSVNLQTTCPVGSYSFNISTLSWLIKAQNASSDTISISQIQTQYEIGQMPEWPAAAYWNEFSKQQVNGAGGALGYLIQINPTQGNYWFNPANGATSLIGATAFPGGSSSCEPAAAAWDTLVNNALYYCLLAQPFAANQLYKFTYSPTTWADLGTIPDGIPNFCGSPPCWTENNITSGVDLNALMAAFAPTYQGNSTGTASKGMTVTSLIGTNQLNHLILESAGNCGASLGYCPGWIWAFDPNATTNSRSGNAGCVGAFLSTSAPGCLIAGTAAYAALGSNNASGRGMPLKADIREATGSGIIQWGAYPWTNAATNGGGPWQVGATGGFAFSTSLQTCPSNSFGVSGTNCTALPIDGQPYHPTPGPNETGARGEYITIQPGDSLGVNNNVTLAGTGVELVRVLVVNMASGTCGAFSAPCIWVQRGFARDYAYCGTPYACGYGNAAVASSANPTLQYPVATSLVMWNYLTDPLGASLVQEYIYATACHRATLNGMDVDSCNAQTTFAPNCVDVSGFCYGSRVDSSGNTYNLLNTSNPILTGTALEDPLFNGVSNNAGGANNITQIHPSAPPSSSSVDVKRYAQDSRPFNGEYAPTTQPCSASNVSGSLWKIAVGCQAGGGTLHRKIYPTKALWGIHPLVDVTPALLLTTSASNYKYCVAVVNGDCFAGSLASEIYFNVPWLLYPYSVFTGQAGNGADLSDITFLDNSAVYDAAMEFPMDEASDRGLRSRTLTHAFSPGKVNAPFFEVGTLGNGAWDILRSRMFGQLRSEVLMIKRPPEVQDSIDRTKYATPSITVPAAPGYAQIKFGYLEYGMNCTTVALSCFSSSSPTLTNPFLFSSETLSPTTCVSGCVIQPSFIPDRIAFWQVARTDSAGNIQSIGPLQALVVR